MRKFEIIGMPAQMGKTKKAIDILQENMELDEQLGKSLHVIFTQNTHTNQTQFITRLSKDLGVECIMSVGSQRFKDIPNHSYTFQDLTEKYVMGEMTPVIVCCSNSIQFSKLLKFVKANDLRINRQFRRVYFYIDEVHASFNMAESVLVELEKIETFQKIYGLSATPQNCEKHGFMHELKLPEQKKLLKKSEEYLFLADHHYEDQLVIESGHTHIDPHIKAKDPNDYAKKVLNTRDYFNEFFSPGKMTFVPSMFHIKYHEQLKDFILQKSERAVVFILNGTHKKFYYHKGGVIREQEIFDENELTEFSEKLLVILNKYKLRENRSYFITGYNCLSLGVTLCNKTVGHFTASIMSHYGFGIQGHKDYIPEKKELDELYQLAARTTGYMKSWDSYKKNGKTKLFCPKSTFDIIEKRELASIENLSELSQIAAARRTSSYSHFHPTLVTPTNRPSVKESQASSSKGNVEVVRPELPPVQQITRTPEPEVTVVIPVDNLSVLPASSSKIKARKEKEFAGKKSQKIALAPATGKEMVQVHNEVERDVYDSMSFYQELVHKTNIYFKIFEKEEKAIEYICFHFLSNDMSRYKKSRKFLGTRCSPVPKRRKRLLIADTEASESENEEPRESEDETYSLERYLQEAEQTDDLVAFPECIGKSVKEIIRLKIGISNTTKYRKVYSQVDNVWVVYWRD